MANVQLVLGQNTYTYLEPLSQPLDWRFIIVISTKDSRSWSHAYCVIGIHLQLRIRSQRGGLKVRTKVREGG